jgi:hypothetical protein
MTKTQRKYALAAIVGLAAIVNWQNVGQAAERPTEQMLMTSKSARESIGIYNYLEVMPKTDEV